MAAKMASPPSTAPSHSQFLTSLLVLSSLPGIASFQPIQSSSIHSRKPFPTTPPIQPSPISPTFSRPPQISSTHSTPSTHSTHPTQLQYSRSICTFDPQDFPPTWPYDTTDFNRIDAQDDAQFYDTPRFVTHIDDRAIESLREYYGEVFGEVAERKQAPLDILDMCSSWISHYPESSTSSTRIPYGRVVGIGMNQEELSQNSQLTEYYVQDLNRNPSLSSPLHLDDESFDILTNAVSIDYLTDPLPVLKEAYKILRPGGVALISFSNRCFPTKAISMWLRCDDVDRLAIVANYFYFSTVGMDGNDSSSSDSGDSSDNGDSGGGGWQNIEALDIKLPPISMPERPSVGDIMKDYTKAFAWASAAGAVAKANSGDPMFVVKAVKPL